MPYWQRRETYMMFAIADHRPHDGLRSIAAADLKDKKKGPRESRTPRVITGMSAESWCHRAPILLK